jgi:parallel beta-helix repeat protein
MLQRMEMVSKSIIQHGILSITILLTITWLVPSNYRNSSDNILTSNTAKYNRQYGIALLSMSDNNLIKQNIAFYNVVYDIFQDSTSIANIYRANMFGTSFGLS